MVSCNLSLLTRSFDLVFSIKINSGNMQNKVTVWFFFHLIYHRCAVSVVVLTICHPAFKISQNYLDYSISFSCVEESTPAVIFFVRDTDRRPFEKGFLLADELAVVLNPFIVFFFDFSVSIMCARNVFLNKLPSCFWSNAVLSCKETLLSSRLFLD